MLGNTSQQNPSFSFGSANNTSAFGSNTGSANASNSASGTAQPFSFGGSAVTSNQKPAASTGGFFGPSNSTNNAFGSGSTTGASGGNFSKPTITSTAPAFGQSTSAQQAGTGELFGAKPAGQTGGIFGSLNSTSSSTGTGLFDGFTAQNTQKSQPSTGLFGQDTSNTTGGLFGASNTLNNQQQTQTQQTQQMQPGTGGLFASLLNDPQPSFGWNNSQTTSNPHSTLSTSLLLNLAAPAQAQKNVCSYTPAISDQIVKLKEQWDPRSSKCALKTYIYNCFSEQEIAVLLQQPRPADESPEDWEKAMSNRTSALHYPVKVSSFSAVAERIEVQLDHVAKSRLLLNNIYEQLNQLSFKHDLDNTTRILKAKVKHAKLSRRLLRLATVLAVLKLKGYPMLPEEEEMSKQFQALNSHLDDPNGPLGKLSDLYARLAILKSRSEDMSAHMESSIQSINGGLATITGLEKDSSGEMDTGNEHIMKQLAKILYKQQVGLSYLNDVVQKDLEKVASVKKGR